MSDTPRIELLRTQGTLWREAEGFSIENNVWIIGSDTEAIVIDAAHDAAEIAEAVGERTVHGILLTHGHEDHVNAALETAAKLDAPLFLHAGDEFLWREIHAEAETPLELTHGDTFTVAGVTLETRHTPGHTPGSVCFVARDHGFIFSGDTLFQGGPGATRWEYSDFGQIITSIEEQLFSLDEQTQVLPGHGDPTTVAAEQVQLKAYIERGW